MLIDWSIQIDNALGQEESCAYSQQGPPATEPTAIAALALFACERLEKGRRLCRWLAKQQEENGNLGVTQMHNAPSWSTSLAVLAWQGARRALNDRDAFSDCIDRAMTSMLSWQGEPIKDTDYLGHNTRLIGWSWVPGTHSWIEPTAFHLIALKESGQQQHARAREAARLLIDRQLPSGGCNCGNTTVLGQVLRPHVMPTGIALVALTGEADPQKRIAKSVSYLRRVVATQVTPLSLSWAILGLAAHGIDPTDKEALIAQAGARLSNQRRTPYSVALLSLAANVNRIPLQALRSVPTTTANSHPANK